MSQLIEKYKTELAKIEKRLSKVQTEYDQFRATCPHTFMTPTMRLHKYPDYVIQKHTGNTGNWCPSDDNYWTEYHCTVCGKKWSEDA